MLLGPRSVTLLEGTPCTSPSHRIGLSAIRTQSRVKYEGVFDRISKQWRRHHNYCLPDLCAVVLQMIVALARDDVSTWGSRGNMRTSPQWALDRRTLPKAGCDIILAIGAYMEMRRITCFSC